MATSRWAGANSSTGSSSKRMTPFILFGQAGNEAQRGRLAGAGRPQEHKELAILDLKRDLLEGAYAFLKLLLILLRVRLVIS